MSKDLVYLIMQCGNEASIIAGPFPAHDNIDDQLALIMEDEVEGIDADGVQFSVLTIDPDGQYPMTLEDITLQLDVEEEDEDANEEEVKK